MGYEWQQTRNGRKYVRTTDQKPTAVVTVQKVPKKKAAPKKAKTDE